MLVACMLVCKRLRAVAERRAPRAPQRHFTALAVPSPSPRLPSSPRPSRPSLWPSLRLSRLRSTSPRELLALQRRRPQTLCFGRGASQPGLSGHPPSAVVLSVLAACGSCLTALSFDGLDSPLCGGAVANEA